jgi:dihydroorotase
LKVQDRAAVARGGRLLDPALGVDRPADVLLVDGRIERIGEGLEAPTDAEIYNAAGKIVAPGFIDARARFREPGLEHAETIESGSRAAASGGFTTVCCLPNTSPYNDSATVTSFMVERARSRGLVQGAADRGADQRRAGRAACRDRLHA